jgi:hypothetical protein
VIYGYIFAVGIQNYPEAAGIRLHRPLHQLPPAGF